MKYTWNWAVYLQPAADGSGTWIHYLLVGLLWTLGTALAAWVIALATLVSGIADYVVGNWRRAFEQCEEAAQLLRAYGRRLVWEQTSALRFANGSLVFLGLGDRERAITWLESAYEDRALEFVGFAGMTLAQRPVRTWANSTTIESDSSVGATVAALQGMDRTLVEAGQIDVDTRFAPEVEAAAYFCCLEALQNCAKHPPGAAVTVSLARRGSTRPTVCS